MSLIPLVVKDRLHKYPRDRRVTQFNIHLAYSQELSKTVNPYFSLGRLGDIAGDLLIAGHGKDCYANFYEVS